MTNNRMCCGVVLEKQVRCGLIGSLLNKVEMDCISSPLLSLVGQIDLEIVSSMIFNQLNQNEF